MTGWGGHQALPSGKGLGVQLGLGFWGQSLWPACLLPFLGVVCGADASHGTTGWWGGRPGMHAAQRRSRVRGQGGGGERPRLRAQHSCMRRGPAVVVGYWLGYYCYVGYRAHTCGLPAALLSAPERGPCKKGATEVKLDGTRPRCACEHHHPAEEGVHTHSRSLVVSYAIQ